MQRFAVAVVLLTCAITISKAQLFNYSDATLWEGDWRKTPSTQATYNLNSILLPNQNDPRVLGSIIYKSMAQNQSYAIGEAVRWALLPTNTSFPKSPEYVWLSTNLGAATAYAMTFADDQVYKSPGPELATVSDAQIMKSGPYPPVPVQPNATDVFFAVVSGALASIANSCDGNWRCHTGDCNTPTQVMNKRASTCCNLLTPLLQAIDRQLVQVQGSDYDLGMALSPELIAQSPYNFGFLNRCLWPIPYGSYNLDTSTAPAGCNAHPKTNYQGDSLVLSVNSVTMGAAPVLTVTDCCNACLNNPKCNVWVFCPSRYGCGVCVPESVNYSPSASASPGARLGPYGPPCTNATQYSPPKFPAYTCTLKSANFGDSPLAYNDPASADFTAGYFKPRSPTQ